MQMLITVTAPDSATGPAARAVGLSIVDELRRAPNVAGVTSAWSAPPAEAKDLVKGRQGRTDRCGSRRRRECCAVIRPNAVR
jgi:RND superfamily putative drug exporter